MEILISMKGEDENKYIYKNPYMNYAFSQSNGYFIAEIRESDDHKIQLLQKYSNILLKKLNKEGNYSIEHTQLGFKLKKKVDVDKEYTEDWDEWVEFSRELYEELEEFFENEII